MPRRISPKVFFLAREQRFRFNVYGLMPNTIHNMYFERQLVSSSRIQPVGGALGDQLKTDRNGYLSFDYFYDAGLDTAGTALEHAQAQSSLVAGRKEVVVTTLSSDQLPANFVSTALSTFRSHIRVQVMIPNENEFTEIDGGYDYGTI